jgi:hypothetical protein
MTTSMRDASIYSLFHSKRQLLERSSPASIYSRGGDLPPAMLNAGRRSQILLLSSWPRHCFSEEAIALRHADVFEATLLERVQRAKGIQSSLTGWLVVVLSSAFPHVVHRRGAAGRLGCSHPVRDHASAEIVCFRRKLLAPTKQTSKRQDQAHDWAV